MKALIIGVVNLKRLTRDRISLFFIFVFPVVVILLIGVSFGGDFTPKLGVVSSGSGDFGAEVVRAVEKGGGLEVEHFGDEATLVDAVERGVVEAGIIVPRGYDGALRTGEHAHVEYVSQPGGLSTALQTTVDSAVADQGGLVRAARFAAADAGVSFEDAYRRAEAVSAADPGVTVGVDSVGAGRPEEESLGRFDLGAASQLVLFIFINSLGGSVALIQSRQLGVSRRILSTPLGIGTLLVGEAIGRFLIAMVQGTFIVITAAVLFGVNWGAPVAATALVIAFALVSTGAAMLFGAILANEHQVAALTPLSLGLAALGGCMVPLEVFPPLMKKVALITPHAWAMQGFTELIRRNAGFFDVLPELGVLLGFAVVLLVAASWSLRRSIVA